jgi:hypothetical protein
MLLFQTREIFSALDLTKILSRSTNEWSVLYLAIHIHASVWRFVHYASPNPTKNRAQMSQATRWMRGLECGAIWATLH